MSINNSSFQRNCNISLVANKIRKNNICSRVQIAEDLQLYKSSVTNLVSILLENNVLVETNNNDDNNIGRKAIGLKINESFGNVVGIEISPESYKLVFINFLGDIIYKESGNLNHYKIEDMIDEVMKKVIKINALLDNPLLAVNIGIPGTVDTKSGIIKYFNEIELYNFDIYNYGIEKYGIPFYVENDANCSAWYEQVKKGNLGDFLSIYTVEHSKTSKDDNFVGVGIGMGVVIDNSVYTGRRFRTGEYCSYTWYGAKNLQTGLSDEIVKNVFKDKKNLRIWLKDLCLSLIPVISVLDVQNIILIGSVFNKDNQILEYIKEDTPGLISILEAENIKLHIEEENKYIVSHGAALMFLQRLFNVPSLEEVKNPTYINWDTIFSEINLGGKLHA